MTNCAVYEMNDILFQFVTFWKFPQMSRKALYKLRPVLEPRRFVNEMLKSSREYRLASSTSSGSFLVREVGLQFPITSL